MTAGQGFTIGTDQSVVIIDQTTNTQIQLDGKRRSMDSKAKDSLLESEPIDDGGLTDARQIPEGWTGTIEVEKSNAQFSAFIKLMDAAYYAQSSGQRYFTIVETIRPPRPTVPIEINTFVDVVFHGYEPGQFQKKSITLARVQFKAAQRV
jgi:hypothetical protein